METQSSDECKPNKDENSRSSRSFLDECTDHEPWRTPLKERERELLEIADRIGDQFDEFYEDCERLDDAGDLIAEAEDLVSEGRRAEAVQQYERALKCQTSVLGSAHPDVVETNHILKMLRLPGEELRALG